MLKQRFTEFAVSKNPNYVADAFHAALGAAFEGVVTGKIKKLLVIVPPGHGSSHSASELLPAYWRLHHPDHAQTIVATYLNDLAYAKQRAATEYGGKVKAVSVGGSLTAFAADLGIVDSPVANVDMGQSPVVRNHVWDWYRTVFLTRRLEHTPIVIILNRTHADDLAGKVLTQPDADEWTVLRFTALAETQKERDLNNAAVRLPAGLPDPLHRNPGEPLSPVMFTKEALLSIKRDIGAARWNMLYQGEWTAE